MTYSETYILSSDQVYTKLYTCILYQYDINLHNFQDIMILCNFAQVNHDPLNLFHHPLMKYSIESNLGKGQRFKQWAALH